MVIKPFMPKSRKLIAYGYRKITSTSNKTKRMAVKKYLIANGCLAFPIDSTPLSKGFNFFFVESRGPIMWVTNIVKPTKPAAIKN